MNHFHKKRITSLCLAIKNRNYMNERSSKEPYFHLLLVRKVMLNAILEIIVWQTSSTKSWGQRCQHNQPLQRRRQRIGERGIWSNGSFQRRDHSTRRRRDRPQHRALANGACLCAIKKPKMWTSNSQFIQNKTIKMLS